MNKHQKAMKDFAATNVVRIGFFQFRSIHQKKNMCSFGTTALKTHGDMFLLRRRRRFLEGNHNSLVIRGAAL